MQINWYKHHDQYHTHRWCWAQQRARRRRAAGRARAGAAGRTETASRTRRRRRAHPHRTVAPSRPLGQVLPSPESYTWHVASLAVNVYFELRSKQLHSPISIYCGDTCITLGPNKKHLYRGATVFSSLTRLKGLTKHSWSRKVPLTNTTT